MRTDLYLEVLLCEIPRDRSCILDSTVEQDAIIAPSPIIIPPSSLTGSNDQDISTSGETRIPSQPNVLGELFPTAMIWLVFETYTLDCQDHIDVSRNSRSRILPPAAALSPQPDNSLSPAILELFHLIYSLHALYRHSHERNIIVRLTKPSSILRRRTLHLHKSVQLSATCIQYSTL